MKILLDTCVLIDSAQKGTFSKLPTKIRKLLQDEHNELLMSAISITEMAVKTSIGKLNVTEDWLTQLIDSLGLLSIPYTSTHAKKLFQLPLHHREPFDRMLIATAISENTPILSSDRNFSEYSAQGLQLISY